jgi:thioesterase domain-containing protein
MIDRSALCTELEETWHREIPMAAAMGVTVESYDGRVLTVRAPLAPNRNVHGTAFAGSLYSTCVLTGWGAMWLVWSEHQLAGSIVAADSTIQYRKAVGTDLVCRCTLNAEAVAAAVNEFTMGGRAKLALSCAIDVEGRRAVTFMGTYVAQTPHH